jgi:hypothetical protein
MGFRVPGGTELCMKPKNKIQNYYWSSQIDFVVYKTQKQNPELLLKFADWFWDLTVYKTEVKFRAY